MPLEAPLGGAMMGYGARTARAASHHDPLHARALYLANSRRDEAGLLVVECDLCLLATWQADSIRERVRERTGVPRERVLVGCIHTHSGPETGLAAILTGGELPAHVPKLFDQVVEAAVAAHASAAPARLGLGHARAEIGRNRRVEHGPVNSDVIVLRVDREDGEPLAVLYLHGCHPTALGHENLAYSADWPGAAGRAIRRALPTANPIFALAAHADVDPRTRGLSDLAIPDQSAGVGFEAMEALGTAVGEAVAKVACQIETVPVAPLGAASARVPIPVHPGLGDPTRDARALEARREAALVALELPPDAQCGIDEFYRLEHERTRHLPARERRERIAKVRLYLRDATSRHFAGGLEADVEVQVLRIGEARLLGLPAEATVDVGLDWQRRVGSPHAAVVSIANGWLRYLPHPTNFEEPMAHQMYEILQSTFVPDAAERLLAAGLRLDRRLDTREARGASR